MLKIWTGAENATVRKVIGPILGRTPVEHEVCNDMTQVPELVQGDVLLACGTKALGMLIDKGYFPKGRTVTSLREKEKVLEVGSVFVTFDPNVTARDYARFPEIQWDAGLAIRRHQTGTTVPKLGEYRWVESLHELIEKVDAKYEETGKPVVVACDTETMGLDEYADGVRILSISFTIEAGKSDMIYFEEGEQPTEPPPWKDPDAYDYWEDLWVQINWILTSEKVSTRGANWKFDSRWLNRRWAINCTNLKMDTLLVGTLLNENISNSLKMHAKLHTDVGGYEDGMAKYDMAHLERVPKAELGQYMGADTDVTYRVSEVFKEKLLKDKKLAQFYTKILHPSAKVFEKVERTGVVVDVPYYHQLETEIEAEQARLQSEMKKLVPRKLYAKFLNDFTASDKNPFAKPKLMHDLFFTAAGYNFVPTQFTEKKGEPSTKIDHLLTFASHPDAKELIGLLSELNSANKTMSTYVRGFMKHLRTDGRFHPHYMLFRGGYGSDDDDSGTNTGRTSAKDPAVQTIPKHTKWTKKLRRAFIPPPGKTILQLDYSQGELKIAACLANETAMINAYKQGKDLHAITAAKLSGYSYDDFMLLPEDTRDALRSNGKAGNFGLIYGMAPPGYVDYAFSSYGVIVTLEEAVQHRESFFDLYTELLPWHDKYKALAKMHGEVRSPLGRIRHLPLIDSRDREAASQAGRNAVNSPVQSTLSDMMQLAMVEIDRQYPDSGVEMFLMTHDSIACYVPEDEATIWAKRLKPILDNLPLRQLFGWDHQLQFTSDVEVAEPDSEGVLSLAKLKKLKNLVTA
jgi:DNA polymerase I-like protein with 3'-5' exonuclease and polymerase domains